MVEVNIKWTEDMMKESTKASEMVRWCKDKKLIVNVDFVWIFDTTERKTTIKFLGENKSMSSYFALVFSSNA